jgi:hypothetical protein
MWTFILSHASFTWQFDFFLQKCQRTASIVVTVLKNAWIEQIAAQLKSSGKNTGVSNPATLLAIERSGP